MLYGFKSHAPEFVVVPTAGLQQRLGRLHGVKVTKIQTYLCVTEQGRCWESRGLHGADNRRIAAGEYDDNADRDFTMYLNQKGWEILINNLNLTSVPRLAFRKET